MSFALRILVVLLAPLAALSAPPPQNTVKARHLSGSSFGVPGDASYDYVIIGGGNAGLTLAARLSKKNTVAVIEAGSFYEIDNGNISQVPAFDAYFTGKDHNDFNPLIDWGFLTTPQNELLNATAHFARGKTLGGCTARNYMAYHRATKQTYQKWADDVGDQSYSFDQWLPFFEKSIHYTPPDPHKRAANATPAVDLKPLATGGPLSVTFSNYAQAGASWVEKGFREIGISSILGFTSGNLLGSSYILGTINAKTQLRDSSETSFLASALDSENLSVYISSLAKRIFFDDKKTAVGVQVDTGGRLYTLSAKREVIVSAGAFQSPQLLMVSGVGPEANLKKHNIPVVAARPGVGQNMWDHVLMGITYRMNIITASSLGEPDFLLDAERRYREDQSGILTNAGGDWLAFEKTPANLRASFSNSTQAKLAQVPADWPEIEYLSMSGFLGFQENFIRDSPADGYNYATVSTALVAPFSRGTIDIVSDDMNDAPLIDPRWLSDPADREVLLAGFKRVRQLFNTTSMQPVLIGSEYFPGEHVQTDDEIIAHMRKASSTVFHPAATCAMGRSSDPNAVVDSKAKVIGVKNLRVVDASAFPFLPPGHPMATVYALAEKIADDILNS
ncbi:Uncharacterized protein BP5553_08218 [Venustampulla echinocandica]|uniref:Glucose-methanol-choline oxidoreductase N-terminal domain-containing protein n=1 Tax=Venustampulla echinocandica TaxID=2656787 RepID=A0A370TG31_9HELO|nr:Uncharacterized protein BP5553_08218 [Venustampulla echinocandica]RDL33850.1 Uncharacterized protein BP5553_08218 [Venustampulla echinocandica]